MVGDKVISINGVEVNNAKHEQAVQMLTGLERFVRLVVEREIPLSQANTTLQLTPGEKSPHVIGGTGPRPYTGLYSANSYMANRPDYTSGYRRSIDADKILTSPTSKTPPPLNSLKIDTTPTINGVAKMNGTSENINNKPPQPAPRMTAPPPAPPRTTTTSTTPTNDNNTMTKSTIQQDNNNHGQDTNETRPTSSQEDIQVPKPITNEEFQAMIPAHFLRTSNSTSPSDLVSQQGPVVTVTIKQPDNLHNDVNFPPAPTTLGKVTEVITKSTLTETVVTRVTDNHLMLPVIIEVRYLVVLHDNQIIVNLFILIFLIDLN